MPSTHTSLHYHIVFSTKDREPRISRNWESTLHKYLGGIIRNIGGKPISIGGIEDHVHLLIGLKPNQCISEVVRDIKSNSSSWVHDEGYSRSFAWQEGYGAFTVSPQMLDQVTQYIRNQREHHRVKTFQEEYVEFLEKSSIEFRPEYLW